MRSVDLFKKLAKPNHFRPRQGARVLGLSMRQLADLEEFSGLYEFEDLVFSMASADVVRPSGMEAFEFGRKIFRATHLLRRAVRISPVVWPAIRPLTLAHEYDLFFPTFNQPHELYAVAGIRNWRQSCQKAICFIAEFRESTVPGHLAELLSGFDHIFLGTPGATTAVAKATGRACTYLPSGVDVLKFSPLVECPQRVIDVCNIGPRSGATHRALLQLAAERKIFYHFDAIQAELPRTPTQVRLRVRRPSEHRLMLASLLKRTRYLIASRAPSDKAIQGGIPARFFEGAAAGAVLIGEPPSGPEFREQFDWRDAVISAPYDEPGIADTISRLDADPERVLRIGRDNVANAALRHDWLHRLRTVFEVARLPATEAMLERAARLKAAPESGSQVHPLSGGTAKPLAVAV